MSCKSKVVGFMVLVVALWMPGCGKGIYRVKPEPADRALAERLKGAAVKLPLEATILFPPGTEELSITKEGHLFPVGEAFTAMLRDASYALFLRPGEAPESQRLNITFEILKAHLQVVTHTFSDDEIISEFQVRAVIKDSRGNLLWSKIFESKASSPLKEVRLVREERPMAMYAAFHDIADRIAKEVSFSEPVVALLPARIDVVASITGINKNGALEGGEEIEIVVDLSNSGKVKAQDVEVMLSGTQAVLGAMGNRRGVGTLAPSSKAKVRFNAVLPAQIAAERAIIQVEVKGKEIPLTLVEVFDLKIESKKKQTVAGDAKLNVAVLVKETNGNRIAEGGEHFTVTVEITNFGREAAENVEVFLTGNSPELTEGMGPGEKKAFVGTVGPGEKQRVEFSATVPEQIPLGQATFQIQVKDRFSSQMEKVMVKMVPKLNVPRQKDAYAVVIGIEKYRDIAGVEFAAQDARTFQSYLTNMMGVPEENTLLLLDDRATKSDIERSFGTWLKNRVTKESTVFIYYAGHGAPYYAQRSVSEAKPDAYLVPFDGDANDLERTGYALADLYRTLDLLPAKATILALDSCFSGTGGRSVRAKGTRPIQIEMEEARPAGQSIITFSAAKNSQISTSYPEGQHGLFTYFFLEGLAGKADVDRSGWVEVEELYDYLRPKVEKQARLVNLQQTPTLSPFPLGASGAVRLTSVDLLK